MAVLVPLDLWHLKVKLSLALNKRKKKHKKILIKHMAHWQNHMDTSFIGD